MHSPRVAGIALVLALASGCKASKKEEQPASSQPPPSAAPSASVVVNALGDRAARTYFPKAPPKQFPVPTGPRLAILAGKGVGPIRLGATVATIERHMARPCDEVNDEVCRYVARAVEFELDGGVVSRITVHRQDRPAGKDKSGKERVYGIFNGAIPPDFQTMMKYQVILDHLGEPLKREKVTDQPQFATEERHYYDGMVVEYDRLDNGNLVLGAVHIEKP